MDPARGARRLHALAVAGVLGLGLCLRLVDLGRPFYGYHMWNEVYYATIARNFEHFGPLEAYNYDWRGGSGLGQRHGPSPFVPWLVHLSFEAFGRGEAAARLPVLVLGVLSLLAIYLVARELYDPAVALLAAFLAAIMPGVVFASRQLALDGPMVAFGLAAVWTLLRARRAPRGRWRWLAASSACLGLAVLAKYTGVLFVPVLAAIWARSLERGALRRRELGALLRPGTYFLAASLPALAWLIRGVLASSASGAGGAPLITYLVRADEWALRSWLRALYTTWVRTGQQVGLLLWYPGVLAALLALALTFTRGRGLAFARAHVETLLLVLPWLVALVYPVSWYQNDAYTYPALYGIAVLLALGIRWAVRSARETLALPRRRLRAAGALLGAVAVAASLADYVQFYGSWYRDFSSGWALQLPANLVSQDDPFASARLVRSLNTARAPILADSPATLYYAQDEPWRGRATWYWWTMPGEYPAMLGAIRSLEYAWVVFTYRPPPAVVLTLGDSGYEHVDLGVWRRRGAP